MKINTIFYIALSYLLLASSCENYLTKEIEFQDIGFVPEMVVNSYYDPETQFLDVSLSKNLNYASSGNQTFEFIEADDISVKVNGEVKYEPLAERPSGPSAQYYNYRFKIAEDFTNKTFTLVADAKNYPSIEADFKVESRAKIIDVDRTERVRKLLLDGEEFWIDNIKITIEDNLEVANFFGIELRNDFRVIYIEANDPSLESTNDSRLLFDDSSFLNGTKTISFDVESIEFEEDVTLRYINMSQERYRYETSILNYQRSQDFGFFAEPVTVYTNVKGGHGIFAIEDLSDIPL